MGRYEKIFQSPTNKSDRKYWDFTIGASKRLGLWEDWKNLICILWGPFSGERELGSRPFASDICSVKVSKKLSSLIWIKVYVVNKM